ncbi:hypothetical protein GUITHDRAFT_145113 [Guillardia theta CCMP2712]|uniref:Ion transport domain-containing protein n=1 Tax=Guillardia theta (strain CCMP2712) TaxID=905079 RepID=L1INB4_GUITC|nr:hypothetical protein GUITHDRAFT_145113 [Guillardia theta CCMP2712]EKX37280.1 hypothetical protein GUITHDRAFT_145113 [Guillardia theta CCMP2712]|eukprot:XP_005824260.1 hypothetical protein GUITHDRAFT_145113 [Guillardia theta CCMP2712]
MVKEPRRKEAKWVEAEDYGRQPARLVKRDRKGEGEGEREGEGEDKRRVFSLAGPVRWECLPQKAKDAFTLNGKIRVYPYFFDGDGQQGQERRTWTDNQIDELMGKAKRGEELSLGYCGASKYLLSAFSSFSIQSKQAMVIGSINPWVEALLLLSKVSTFEQWSDVVFSALAVTQPGQQPIPQQQPSSILFFHLWVIISCFFLLQLVIGVLIDAINQRSGIALYTDTQRNWLRMRMRMSSLNPLLPDHAVDAG